MGWSGRWWLALALRRVHSDVADAQHVGGTRGAKRYTGGDDNPLSRLGETFLESDPVGPVNHVIQVPRVFGQDAMNTPNKSEATGCLLDGCEDDDG